MNGTELRARRDRLRLTNRQLDSLLGVSSRTRKRYFAGTTPIPHWANAVLLVAEHPGKFSDLWKEITHA